jgi:nucleotide-binding universal stress UspA family protein
MTTLTVERILFATDFLESSRLALDYALALAHHFGAEILMLHAMELPEAAEEAEALTGAPSASRKHAQHALENLARKVRRGGIRARTCVVEGRPDAVILETAMSEKTDLLVLGVHGIHRGMSHLLLGSNTEKIILAAPCPTLTVGSHVRAGVDLDLNLAGVLYLASLEDGDAASAPYAERLAASFGVPLQIEYVADAAARDEAVEEQIALQEEDAGDQEEPEGAGGTGSHRRRPLSGDSVAMLRRVHGKASHLIVTCVDSESFMQRRLRPSFAYELVANAVSPVITINKDLSVT